MGPPEHPDGVRGKDQLAQQDGELSRLTAEIADKIIKEALQAMGNTVLAAGVTPDKLSSILGRLLSHQSKYPVLADTLKRYAGSERRVRAINQMVAKAQYFQSKSANVGQNHSDLLIADFNNPGVTHLFQSPFSDVRIYLR